MMEVGVAMMPCVQVSYSYRIAQNCGTFLQLVLLE